MNETIVNEDPPVKLHTVRRILDLGIYLKVSISPSYRSQKTDIETIEQAIELEEECDNKKYISYDINLSPNNKYPEGLVCVDIDDEWVWKQVEGMERQGLLNEIIFNPTKRGRHIIFAATHNRKSKIGAT